MAETLQTRAPGKFTVAEENEGVKDMRHWGVGGHCRASSGVNPKEERVTLMAVPPVTVAIEGMTEVCIGGE